MSGLLGRRGLQVERGTVRPGRTAAAERRKRSRSPRVNRGQNGGRNGRRNVPETRGVSETRGKRFGSPRFPERMHRLEDRLFKRSPPKPCRLPSTSPATATPALRAICSASDWRCQFGAGSGGPIGVSKQAVLRLIAQIDRVSCKRAICEYAIRVGAGRHVVVE